MKKNRQIFFVRNKNNKFKTNKTFYYFNLASEGDKFIRSSFKGLISFNLRLSVLLCKTVYNTNKFYSDFFFFYVYLLRI